MESKEGVSALFQFAAEGILVANEKGEITQANPSAERLFGYEKNELIGGLLTLGIPHFKLEKWVLSRRVDRMSEEGVVIFYFVLLTVAINSGNSLIEPYSI